MAVRQLHWCIGAARGGVGVGAHGRASLLPMRLRRSPRYRRRHTCPWTLTRRDSEIRGCCWRQRVVQVSRRDMGRDDAGVAPPSFPPGKAMTSRYGECSRSLCGAGYRMYDERALEHRTPRVPSRNVPLEIPPAIDRVRRTASPPG